MWFKNICFAVSEAETEIGTPNDLLGEIEQLESDLDKKITKKNKYKQLYKEQQEARLEELKEKDAEIAKLKKKLRDPSFEMDFKIRALEVTAFCLPKILE